nr:hypothetical protein [uncultured Cohaesibacter sp.]
MQHDEEKPVAEKAKSPSGGRALILDPNRFRPYLAEAGYSREQEEALLQSIWQIIVGFVELGFDIRESSKMDDSAQVEIDLYSYLVGDTGTAEGYLKSDFDAQTNSSQRK